MSFSNLSDIIKYLSDGDLVADKYGNDVRISESGNARFKTIKLDGNIDMNGFSINNLGGLNATIATPSQPNITALGPLTSIVMAGDITMNNNDILNAGDITASTLTGT